MNMPKGITYHQDIDQYEVQSYTQRDAIPAYLVTCDRETRTVWTCTCKGFMFSGKECKHIARVKFIDEARLKGVMT